ncbi:MAG: indolepyruvate oxidoreductase subunit beta [candidate division WOR-3 bacterium]|nr:indolepyruvate oxidoreductase subunit beta [candidate division WOR-3 bacterium]MCX7757733.1 indolepyruvate oxidoreductase subunit beta [candidate division WOR-3 bacterium]MDW7988154.1 indolepyruvate oxidoreductase subunit beta [candidate division WOR-3 bacterium]
MRNKVTNILVCGVGGQGILLFTDILGEVAMNAGFDIKKSEVHGMAQRGGSVVSQLRFGPVVYSPLIPETEAHFIVALEKLEALRYIHYLSPKGKALVDPLEIYPMSVLTGEREYPKDIIERLKRRTRYLYLVEAFKTAQDLGEARAQNIVMLGVLSRFLGFPDELYEEAIKKYVRPKYHEINLKAFRVGKEELKIS